MTQRKRESFGFSLLILWRAQHATSLHRCRRSASVTGWKLLKFMTKSKSKSTDCVSFSDNCLLINQFPWNLCFIVCSEDDKSKLSIIVYWLMQHLVAAEVELLSSSSVGRIFRNERTERHCSVTAMQAWKEATGKTPRTRLSGKTFLNLLEFNERFQSWRKRGRLGEMICVQFRQTEEKVLEVR